MRLSKMISPGEDLASWYWEVVADNGHVVACGLVYDRELALEQARQAKAAGNFDQISALCFPSRWRPAPHEDDRRVAVRPRPDGTRADNDGATFALAVANDR